MILKRNEYIKILFQTFDRCVEEYAKKTKALNYKINDIYKGENIPENIKEKKGILEYREYNLEFIYTSHIMLGSVNSILEIFISFKNIAENRSFPLSFLIDFLDIRILKALIVPNISNPKLMEDSFLYFENIIEKIEHQIKKLSKEQERLEAFMAYFKNEMLNNYNLEEIDKDKEVYYKKQYYQWLKCRMTSYPYIMLFNLETKKNNIISKFSKLKNLSQYEVRLIELMKEYLYNDFDDGIVIPDSIKSNLKDMKPIGKKGSWREPTSIIISWFALIIPCIPIYLLVYLCLSFVESKDTILTIGVFSNAPDVMLPSFITAILFSYFTRLYFYRILFKKTYEKTLENDYISISEKTNRIMKKFLAIGIFLSFVSVVLMVRHNVLFKDEGFIDNSGFFDFVGDYYEYSDIKRVYFLKERDIGFDTIREIPSYVIELENGYKIDLYDVDVYFGYEDELIRVLKEKNIKIE